MKTIKIILIGTILFLNITKGFSQTDKIVAAFSKSYSEEKNADYVGAIMTIKEVYDAKSYELNLRLGWLYYEVGQNKESISFYQLAMNLIPNSIEAKLAYVYPAAALGNMDQVIAQYKKVLEIDPQNTTANYKMGMIYYYKKDYPTAYNYFEKVVNIYPFGYDALLMYAWSNYQTGKTAEAKVLFNKVLMLSPNDTSALEGLALIK